MEFDKKSREALFQELQGKKYILRKQVKVGINQGQLFIRIPKKISKEIGIDKNSKVEFVMTKSPRKVVLELTVIK